MFLDSNEGLSDAEILTIIEQPREEVASGVVDSPVEHPWLKFSGMFSDDSLFDEALAEIENYRREIDAGDVNI